MAQTCYSDWHQIRIQLHRCRLWKLQKARRLFFKRALGIPTCLSNAFTLVEKESLLAMRFADILPAVPMQFSNNIFISSSNLSIEKEDCKMESNFVLKVLLNVQ